MNFIAQNIDENYENDFTIHSDYLNKKRCLEKVRQKSFFNPLTKEDDTNQNIVISTTERFPVLKMYIIIYYLEDRFFIEKCDVKKEKIKMQLKYIKEMLSLQKNHYYYLQDGFMVRHMKYVQKTDGDSDESLGRLFGILPSPQVLKREVRYYLFNEVYTDVDIVNAHPSIMYEYACKNNLESNTLEKYVKNREDFMKAVKLEDPDIENPKREILSVLNYVNLPPNAKSNSLKAFIKDIKIIREHIWKHFFTNDREKFFETKWKEKRLEKQKVSLQSYYCQTQETAKLLALYDFLQKKQEETPLEFVPFFDGAFIRFENTLSNKNIDSFLKQYNETDEFINFTVKEMDYEEEIIEYKQLRKYEYLVKTYNKLKVADKYALFDMLKSIKKQEYEDFINSCLTLYIEEPKEPFSEDYSLQEAKKLYESVIRKHLISLIKDSDTQESVDKLITDYIFFNKKHF